MTDTPSTPDTEQEPATDFAVTLLALNKGATHTDLTDKMRELVAAVTKVKKAGKLSLTLTVKPQPGVDGAVIVAGSIKSTVPQFEPRASIFFATEGGDLVRDDPTQNALFREITTSPKENRK